MMNGISTFFGDNLSHALGWTIVHSLWQVSLLALLMSGFLKIYEDKTSTIKHNIALGTMATSLVVSIGTFLIYFDFSASSVIAENMVISIEAGTLSSAESLSMWNQLSMFFHDNMHHINAIWIVGMIVFLLRFLVAYSYVKYVKSTAINLENDDLKKMFFAIYTSMGIQKSIALMESSKVSVPMVIGYLKPVVLFPIGMINLLSQEEIEAVIVHELSHIKRNDYLINILANFVEIMYYFHPAMWWISANIKAERENSCDDAALKYNITPVAYAKALVKLEELRKSGTPTLAMPLASNKHQLLNRVKRILNMQQTKNDIREKSIATILLLSIGLLFTNNAISNNDPQLLTEELVEIEESKDTLRIKGNDEIVMKVKHGKFSSLTVDGETQEEGEFVDQMKTMFTGKNYKEDSKIEGHTFFMKGNPMLVFKEGGIALHGDESHAHIEMKDEEENIIKADTIPLEHHFEKNESILFKTTVDKQKVEIQRENGEVISLKVDGEEIPKSEIKNYQDLIDRATEGFYFDIENSFDFNNDFDFDQNFKGLSNDSIFSRSFGLLFDGDNWREFGGNVHQFMDEDVIEKLRNLEDSRIIELDNLENMFENIEELELLKEMDSFKNLERFEGLEKLERFEGLENLQEQLERMGIDLDSSMKTFNFRQLPNFEGFDGFEYFDDDNIQLQRSAPTVVDKIADALNRDGLLQEYKSNEVEISGKHLKINGEKMPKALFNKYKNIYQESTGAPLTKKSKMVFNIEGKPSKRKVKTF